MTKEQIDFLKNVIIPVASSLIAFLSVCVALITLVFSRKDRKEAREQLEKQEAIAEETNRRQQQEEIFRALQGDKESVGFMALQLSRNKAVVGKENQDTILSSLSLAIIFNNSSRARAFALKALTTFTTEYDPANNLICDILKDIKQNFKEYDEFSEHDELEKYHKRLNKLLETFLCKEMNITGAKNP